MQSIKLGNFEVEIYPFNDQSPTIFIFPGGGYMMNSENEGKPVAKRFNEYGFSSVVLKYCMHCGVYPKILEELDGTLKYVCNNATNFNISVTQCVGIGFSAGGNLLVNYIESIKADKYHFFNYNLRAIALCYGMLDVSSLSSSNNQLQQFYESIIYHMTGQTDNAIDHLRLLSPMYHIANIPTFLWHTRDDALIPCEQTLQYSLGLKQMNIPFELHVFESGPHGLSLADKTTASHSYQERKDISIWVQLFVIFVKKYLNAK